MNESQLDRIADALAADGYGVFDNVLPISLLRGLLTDFNGMDAAAFRSAGIGRQDDFRLQDKVRSDQIHWLEGVNPATTEFLQTMDSLRHGLNRRLFLGLIDYESHFAYYPVGAFYKKHLDAFKEKKPLTRVANNSLPHQNFNRVISTVVYLNENWQSDEGGELVIYNDADNAVVKKIVPLLGRMVIFLSDRFPHEVLPAQRVRISIAGWFRATC